MTRVNPFMSMQDIAEAIGAGTTVHDVRRARTEHTDAMLEPDILIGVTAEVPTYGWKRKRVERWIGQVREIIGSDTPLASRHLQPLREQRRLWWMTDTQRLIGSVDMAAVCRIKKSRVSYALRRSNTVLARPDWLTGAVTVGNRTGWPLETAERIMREFGWNPDPDRLAMLADLATPGSDISEETRFSYERSLRTPSGIRR